LESATSSIRRFFGSPGFKFFLICGLILALLIPMLFVWFLVSEREQRANEVRQEVAREWGSKQFINGPFLIVPYTVKVVVTGKDGERSEKVQERYAAFMPATLDVSGKATTKVLHRAIYDVPVYSGSFELQGSFDAPDFAEVDPEAQTVRWKDAILAVAISDVSALKAASAVRIGTAELPFEPSLGALGGRTNGIHARLADAAGLFALPSATPGAPQDALPGFKFAFALTLNGTSGVSFAPVARETVVNLSTDWPDPSFTGAFLPNDREITQDSFSARWQVPHLARSVPQAWQLAKQRDLRMGAYKFGVDFIVPVDFYQLVSRAAKYATMFLATAFMAVFVIELRSSRKVHAVQYMLVGLAMAFFYVLLLSFAEQIGFLPAYLIASGATVGLISLYVGFVQASAPKGLVMLLVLSALYGLLYLILQLEDYALLAGAIAGFVMLAAVMFGTLKVNWSGEEAAQAR
jgi:inner membrane protein